MSLTLPVFRAHSHSLLVGKNLVSFWFIWVSWFIWFLISWVSFWKLRRFKHHCRFSHFNRGLILGSESQPAVNHSQPSNLKSSQSACFPFKNSPSSKDTSLSWWLLLKCPLRGSSVSLSQSCFSSEAVIGNANNQQMSTLSSPFLRPRDTSK